jgi:uncharacterized protein
MKQFAIAALAIIIVYSFSLTVHALDFHEARSKKLIKEESTGYVTAVDPSAKAIADDVNAKRKKSYEEAAKAQNVPIEEIIKKMVEKIQKEQGGK